MNKAHPEKQRCRITLRGTVQGVGFRPFVCKLARQYKLSGRVYNSRTGLLLEAEGGRQAVDDFVRQLLEEPPPLARITGWDIDQMECVGDKAFLIDTSTLAGGKMLSVPPDIATCAACHAETADQRDRRFAYPFTNCTQCGPRFTIINDLPYDRPATAMHQFALCPHCMAEYQDFGHRRFHAQATACPRCGPKLELVDRAGRPINCDALATAVNLLQEGKVLAVKGLGGFHLAVDANNAAAVDTLRQRKGRAAKPFAVMARDVSTVRKYCYLSPAEEELLCSQAAPIVLLPRRSDAEVAPGISPGLDSLGVMLPYTPLHQLLLALGPELLVMTSGNPAELPLVKDNQDALVSLAALADYFLWHDRAIVSRCDDSVVALRAAGTHFYRRSRGYVPRPLEVSLPAGPGILAIGGDLKNTFCVLEENNAFLSQHIGDLDSKENQDAFRENLKTFRTLLPREPEVVACDLHPRYHSRRLAAETGLKMLEVQHHHAHMAACLAENGLTGKAIGVIFDGTGYGPDGAIWGGEFFTGTFSHYKRHCHLRYFALPGSNLGVRLPWYAAAGLLSELGLAGAEMFSRLFAGQGRAAEVVMEMVLRRVNTVSTSSVGRLFDAVAALTGLCLENSYDAQAAIMLEEAAKAWGPTDGLEPYPYKLANDELDLLPAVEVLLRERLAGVEPEKMAARFHVTLVRAVVHTVETIARQTGLTEVAVSGGVWHNAILLSGVQKELTGRGFNFYTHRQVPTNDGGLSLGQAAVARSLLADHKSF